MRQSVQLSLPPEAYKLAATQRSEPKNPDAYIASVLYDFAMLKEWLIPGDVLEIGCGIGSMSSLLAKHCGGDLHLLDGTGDGERKVNYGPKMDPYNDRSVTEAVLRANGVGYCTWHDVGARHLPKVDNVVSTISWGWHYPVSTYIDVLDVRPGGRVILDLRPGKGGAEQMELYGFKQIGSFQGFGKCNKTVWQCA